MAQTKKRALAIVLFVVVFGAMLLTATFTDLQISRILTKNALVASEYYSNDFFGVTLECVGSSPVYLVMAFAFQILFWYALRICKNKPLCKGFAAVSFVLSVVANYICVDDVFRYAFERYEEIEKGDFVKGISAFFALMLTVVCILAVRNFSDESIKKLLRFSIAVICVVAVSSAAVAIIKIPMGRPRFRAMNTIGDFSGFSRWYVANGQPDKELMLRLYGTTDACKSFPSGHTCAAGASYCVIMLIDALGIKARWKRALLWICPIAFIGAVAVSRIMVGAHFFSDVLVGGTVAFLCVMLFRELIVRKGQKAN